MKTQQQYFDTRDKMINHFKYGLLFLMSLFILSMSSAYATDSASHKKLILSDVKLNSSFGVPSIDVSANGDKVFVGYGNPPFPGLLQAQLFRNQNGKLMPIASIPVAVGPDPSTGLIFFTGPSVASKDFQTFITTSVAQPDSHTIIGRVKVYNEDLVEINSADIIENIPGDASFITTGPTLSEDSQYIAISLSDGETPESDTTVIILNTSDLTEVVRTKLCDLKKPNNKSLCGVVGQNIEWITLEQSGKKRYYLTMSVQHGYPTDSDNNALTTKPPYFVQMYEFKPETGTIQYVAESELPRYAEIDVLKLNDSSALIAVGGWCTVKKKELSLFDDLIKFGMNPAPEITAIPNDAAEARILKFDGNALQVTFKRNMDCCTRLTFYPPGNGEILLVGQNLVANSIVPNAEGGQDRVLYPEYYYMARVVGDNELIPLSIGRSDAGRIPQFSEDGQWLARVREYGFWDLQTFTQDPFAPADVDKYGINNLLYYQVQDY